MKLVPRYFWKTYFVDILLFVLLFFLGWYTKLKLKTFFSRVGEYQAQIQAIEPGLENRTTEALLVLEPILREFQSLTLWVFVLFVILLPFLLYLLLTLSQSLNLAILQRNVSLSFIGKMVVRGLPFLGVFYLFLFLYLQSVTGIVLTVGFLLLFLLSLYLWYTGAIVPGTPIKKLVATRTLFSLAPGFLAIVVVFLVLLGLDTLFLFRFLTSSFFGTAWVGTLVVFLLLLGFLQALRAWYVRKASAVDFNARKT